MANLALTEQSVVKRNGLLVSYDRTKILSAIERCLAACNITVVTPEQITEQAERLLLRLSAAPISVETIQDCVEEALMLLGLPDAARSYILYRAERSRLRNEGVIPDEVQAAFQEDDQYFPTPLQRFQFMDKYSRWNAELGRRETWTETVARAVDFLRELSQSRLPDAVYDELADAIRRMEVMPSMRLLAMAGPAARRDHTAIMNCSFQGVDSLDSFVEALLISMAGCGVGYSVERQFISQLPAVQPQDPTADVILHVVEDSAEGWGEALRLGLTRWFAGQDVQFDFSLIRPHGAVLQTKGGRASGPEPLRKMLAFVRERILARQGGHLRSLDAHDMMCEIGNAAVSGGVRRTAMIALFDEDDAEMLAAKAPGFEAQNSQRWNANNSAVWREPALMDQVSFIDRFMRMVHSGNGEPGIFSRDVAHALLPARRHRSDLIGQPYPFGTNPCGEISLRPRQFCNLSAAVARRDDTFTSLARKVRLATIIGTIQSAASHFPSLRSSWRKNQEEERLLGVDITGQMDCPLLFADGSEEIFDALRRVAIETNLEFAQALGINPSAGITCVKPSGNTSVLVNCASGLHARWSPYQIKRVRVSASSPMYKVLRDAGVPMRPENGQEAETAITWVVSFPVKAPDGAITRNDRSAVEQCEHWLKNKLHWTEHNPSVTITYRPHEILDLMQWVWDHRDKIGGMSFLPSFDAQYDQLPNEEISQEAYEQMVAEFPAVDWSRIWLYERDDHSTASQTKACESELCLLP